METKRLGNIEFRLTKSFGPNPYDYVDVVFWYPNPHYGREADYLKKGEWYVPKDDPSCYSIHQSCFKHPESCYSLASIDIEEEPCIRCVELRPFELKPKDDADFRALVRMAYDYAISLWREQQRY